MSTADKELKLLQLEHLYSMDQDEWQQQGIDAPTPSNLAINNAKAITVALCALEIKHSIYPILDNDIGGIVFEFNQAPMEIRCSNNGEVKTEVDEGDDITIAATFAADSDTPGCSDHSTIEPHTCPYAVEINNDSDTHCQCCSACENQCALDI